MLSAAGSCYMYWRPPYRPGIAVHIGKSYTNRMGWELIAPCICTRRLYCSSKAAAEADYIWRLPAPTLAVLRYVTTY